MNSSNIATRLQRQDQFAQRDFTLTQNNEIGAFPQVVLVMVGAVAAADDDGAAVLFAVFDHPERSFAHVGEAHFGQVVEAVVVKHHVRGFLGFEQRYDLFRAFPQIGIEQRHPKATFPHDGGGIERTIGWEGLFGLPLLRIEAVKVGVGEKYAAGHAWELSGFRLQN